MSEYQYYEFQAVDRTLGPEEIATLRQFSSRAQITPSSFINEYSFGSFKGYQDDWMARYFDAFLHFANWGRRILMFRLPSSLLPEASARDFVPNTDRHASGGAVRSSDGQVILKFSSHDEAGRYEWIEGGGLLGRLLPLRTDLARGDLRALYLGWLRGIQEGYGAKSGTEPAVPQA